MANAKKDALYKKAKAKELIQARENRVRILKLRARVAQKKADMDQAKAVAD